MTGIPTLRAGQPEEILEILLAGGVQGAVARERSKYDPLPGTLAETGARCRRIMAFEPDPAIAAGRVFDGDK
jgi:hypothetical protein